MRINFSFFVFAVLCAAAAVFVSPRPPSSVRCGSRGATAAVFQGIPFVAATSGVLVRVRLCACWYAILNTIWTLGILPLIFKSARAVHRHPNSYGTTSSEPHLGSYTYGMYEGTPVFPLFNLVARLYTTVQVWVQAGLRGACSGRSTPVLQCPQTKHFFCRICAQINNWNHLYLSIFLIGCSVILL